jgi:hypothetical protein
MGLQLSKITPPSPTNSICGASSDVSDNSHRCNNDCPVCQKSGKVPNIAGKFFIINDTECKCNACNSVFPKEQFYKPVVEGQPTI